MIDSEYLSENINKYFDQQMLGHRFSLNKYFDLFAILLWFFIFTFIKIILLYSRTRRSLLLIAKLYPDVHLNCTFEN